MAEEMNQLISEFFGTGQNKTASAEDQEKIAQVELFSKLAAEGGIELDKLTDAQISHLWHETFSEKTAEAAETPAPAADVEKRAQEEYAEKRAAAVKIAEAEYLGKVMAHAMVQELGKIGEATKTAAAGGSTLQSRLLKVAGELPPWLNKGKGDKDGDKDDKGGDDKGDKKAPPFGKKDDKDEKKEASAFDAKAAEVAVKIAKDAKMDVDEAGRKVAAVLTLGAKESTKVASAPDFSTGLHIRALELLEQAGYPVQWGESA